MPIQTDLPSGLGSEDKWGLEGAPNKIQAVASHDGDSSIVYADSGGAVIVQRFTFPLIAGVADPVNDADLYCYAREYAPGLPTRLFYFHWNSAVSGTEKGTEIHAARPNYALVTTSIGAATLAAVNGEHGFQMASTAGGPSNQWEVWVTQFWRTVDFTYPAGDAGEFAHLIGSLATMIGANLLMRNMPSLARLVAVRTGLLIKPQEYAEALAAWRRERHVHLVGA